ncbi:MAG: glycosyltransferase [Vulcanimicrobiaceae bacterium]
MVVIMRLRAVPDDGDATALGEIYLRFLKQAQRADGMFRNFRSGVGEKAWLDELGSEDSCGRAVWSLGYGLRYAPDPRWRAECGALLARALPAVTGFSHVRARAFAVLGLAHALESSERTDSFRHPLEHLAAALAAAYDREHRTGWEWFDDHLTYDNARLPESVLRAAHVLADERLRAIGLESLAFYENVTLLEERFVPIGSNGWYWRGRERAFFAQQPLEATAMIDAELAAFDATGDRHHLQNAYIALEWYLGRNTVGAVLAHPSGGGRDGLEETGASTNMGAESTLAYLAASYAMAEREGT